MSAPVPPCDSPEAASPATPRNAAHGSAAHGPTALRPAGAPTYLGIELGSTRIKACLVGEDHEVIASGSHSWENELVDGSWTYALPDALSGVRSALSELRDNLGTDQGALSRVAAMGVSAMMHGYLALDAENALLVPFRTWRNTSTGAAAAELTELFSHNVPLRWSVAHYRQAMLAGEEHVGRVAHLTTLAGYVHWRLTGRHVLGVGDASGMFPLDPTTCDYDGRCLALFDALSGDASGAPPLRTLLPTCLTAGQDAGVLTQEGAALLGGLVPAGIPLAPPEGDAGTGMVATNAVEPRSGNVSVGTSVFAMVVLERPLARVHPEIDLVTTPAGELVAMVHCNNGASELAAWAGLLRELVGALGHDDEPDAVFAAFLRAALAGAPDGGGLLAFNDLAGEPITGTEQGRPLVVRTPDSRFDLATFARVQVYAVFSALALGMRLLAQEGVAVDVLHAHGGLFRTAGVAQRLLAAATATPVAVGASAGEGGAWGMAILAAYRSALVSGGLSGDDDAASAAASTPALGRWLAEVVFASDETTVEAPGAGDVAGFAEYLSRYERALELQRLAPSAVPLATPHKAAQDTTTEEDPA